MRVHQLGTVLRLKHQKPMAMQFHYILDKADTSTANISKILQVGVKLHILILGGVPLRNLF